MSDLHLDFPYGVAWIPGFFTNHPNGGGWVSRDCHVHPSASLASRSVITEGTTVGPGCTIGEGVVVASCVIGSRVKIAKGWTRLSQCTVADEVRIGESVQLASCKLGARVCIDEGISRLDDCVIGEGAHIGRKVEIREGGSIEPGVSIPANAFLPRDALAPQIAIAVLTTDYADKFKKLTVIHEPHQTRVASVDIREPISLDLLEAYARSDQAVRDWDQGFYNEPAQLLAICNILREWSSLPAPQRTQHALDALSAKLPPLEPFKPNPEPQVLYYDNPHHPKDFKLLTRFTAAVPPQTADRLAQDWNLCHQLAAAPSQPPADITLGPHYLGDEHDYLTLISALMTSSEGACLNPAQPVTEEQHSIQGLLLRASRATQPHPAQPPASNPSNTPIIRFAALNTDEMRAQAATIQGFNSINFHIPEDQYLHRLKHFYFVTDSDNKVTNPVHYQDMVHRSQREQDLLTRLVDDRWTLICIELGETAPTTPNYVDLSDLRGW